MNLIKRISPIVRIFIMAIVLILLPAAVLSYIGFISVNERARNLEAGYRGTLLLVRDRIEQDILRLEQDFRSSLENSTPVSGNQDASRRLLQQVESANPWMRQPFLVLPGGGILTPSLFLEASQPTRPEFNSTAVGELFRRAEKEEFEGKDLQKARRLYAEAFEESRSVHDRAILLSRTGRCDFKTGNYRAGISQYRRLLQISDPRSTVGGIPSFIIALTQIADGYAALDNNRGRFDALLELYERLINSSSIISADKCAYYLTQTGRELEISATPPSEKFKDLEWRGTDLLEEIRMLEWMHSTLLPQISLRLSSNAGSPAQEHIIEKYNGTSVQFGYFQLPASSDGSAGILGYRFDGYGIVSDLLPGILNNVNLGRDIGIGILDETDKLRFSQVELTGSAYLAAASFTEILPSWKVVMAHSNGKSVDQLVSREKWTYLALLAATFLIMITGILLTMRAAVHELELSRLKAEFVSNVSHELKTPLSLIRMFGETLESGIVQDESKRSEFYRIIRSESERLTRLINNVLDFSKIEAGTKRYNFQEEEIGSIVGKALEAYKLEIRNLGFTIDCRLPSKPIRAMIDPDAICEALLNLLDNAAKYSDEVKQISVVVEENRSWVRISVSDRGVGIPGNELNSIFDKYYRSQTQKARETAGSGLGLTLLKHIIEAHGGRVEVDSEVGKGSTFALLIPVKN